MRRCHAEGADAWCCERRRLRRKQPHSGQGAPHMGVDVVEEAGSVGELFLMLWLLIRSHEGPRSEGVVVGVLLVVGGQERASHSQVQRARHLNFNVRV